MFCKKCGKQIIEGNSFCTGCGNRVSFPDAIPQQMIQNAEPETAEVPKAPVICESPEVTPAFDDFAPPPMVKRKSNKGLVITISICGILLAVLIGMLAFFAVNGGFGPNDNGGEKKPGVSDTGNKKKTPYEKKAPKKPAINEIDENTVSSYIQNTLNHTDFGIYVYNYTNDYEFGYNENLSMPASAMCQVVILDTLSQAAREKELNMDVETMQFTYLANGKEAPESPDQDGEILPLKQYILDVAKYGDNNKSNQIVDYIGHLYDDNGFDVINDKLDDNGYTYTSINRKVYVNSAYIDHNASPNFITAKEISKIFSNLINKCSYGSKEAMINMFASISNDGEEIGLSKYVPDEYSMCSVNGLNSQSTNDVAIISKGDSSILVAILAYTNEDYVKTEDNDLREAVQKSIIEYILSTQFTD